MILDRIVARKKEEVAVARAARRQRGGIALDEATAALVAAGGPPRGFRRALVVAGEVAVIAEAKKASPSKGVIQPDFDPVRIARWYKEGGARAMSVLTDVDFFQGSLAYIPQVRSTVDLPVLRKDFIIDAVQIEEARAHGADAILLIAAILDAAEMRDFRQMAAGLGMDSLVEVHDEAELEQALLSGADLVGVNNRNLKDFSMDLETTFRLRRLVPDDVPLVSESGIRDRADMQRLAQNNVQAALIGETLMRAGDPVAALRELLGRDED